MTPTVIIALAGSIAFVFGVALTVLGGGRKDELAARSLSGDASAADLGFYDSLGERFEKTKPGKAVALRIERGNLSFSPIDFAFGTSVTAVVVLVASSRILPLPVAVLAAVSVFWAAWLYLKRRDAQRTQRFIEQLSDIARILSGASFAGLSVGAGIQIAARELAEPAGSEMALVAERLAIGGTLESAMDDLRTRVPSREVSVLIGTLLIQQRAGGDTVRSLGDIAEVLESRADTLREVRNILGPPTLTNVVLPGIGIAVLLLSNVFRPGALKEALTDPIGIGLLAFAFLLWSIGIYGTRRVSRLPDWYEDDAGSSEGRAVAT